ncbi:DUF2793 domain-containing protein [Abyssibius alkaniclasticus]|uniref:DUF2793 domain-containing protein n=1 Tax=Abyssibius alkaniclasticus TaxID=2881234 RepID=UPI0040582A0E
MSESYNLNLPLIVPGQAQKHVTVNEALARLDALAQLRLVARGLNTPPASAVDGAAYGLGAAPSGAWAGQAGQIAIASNGGWSFVAPRLGWVAWDEASKGRAVFDGAAWVANAQSLQASGAATLGQIAEVSHVIGAGATSTTAAIIPQNAVVIGVTGRVTSAITGAGLTGWRLGVAGADNRYGAGLGLGLNAYALGVTGQPQAYYAPTPLVLSGEGGSFAGGEVLLAVHYMALQVPRAV